MIDVNKLEFKKFPGGELHITDKWIQDYYEPLHNEHLLASSAICRIQNSDDIMKLLLFVDAYTRQFGKLDMICIPYVPYARQDRVPNKGEALSIKVFTSIINSLNTPIFILDPHSDVTTALFDNVIVKPQWEIFEQYVPDKCDIIAPDAGALKKVYKLVEECKKQGKEVNLRTATKHRDTQTGWITGTTLDGEKMYNTCVVVDDICDGGGTFIALVQKLKEEYSIRKLMVTHGIFSKGINVLLNDEHGILFNEIITTDSFRTDLEESALLKVIKIQD